MSWNTWLMSMTKMENLSDSTLLEMRNRIHHMLSVYQESSTMGGLLARKALKEMDKCYEQLERVESEITRRGKI